MQKLLLLLEFEIIIRIRNEKMRFFSWIDDEMIRKNEKSH